MEGVSRRSQLSGSRRFLFKAMALVLPLAACALAVALESAFTHVFRSREDRILQDASKSIPTVAELVKKAHPVLLIHLDAEQMPTAGKSIFERLLGTQRVAFLQEPGHQTTGHRYMYDPLLGWKNIPNWRATTRGQELSINSLGLRDREHPYVKPTGVKRTLVLGDSFAWGYGVGDGATFSDVLEASLTKGEVLNAGVSGWGTDQEYLFLVSEGYRYSPDLVVLAFYMENDITNNMHSMQYGMHKPYFEDESLTLKNIPVPPPSAPHKAVTSPRGMWITLKIVRSIQSFCQEIGANFLLCLFGANPKSESDRAMSLLMLEQVSRSSKGYFLDLDATFEQKKISKESLHIGNFDGHWNAFGHRKAAESIHDFILANDLLK